MLGHNDNADRPAATWHTPKKMRQTGDPKVSTTKASMTMRLTATIASALAQTVRAAATGRAADLRTEGPLVAPHHITGLDRAALNTKALRSLIPVAVLTIL